MQILIVANGLSKPGLDVELNKLRLMR